MALQPGTRLGGYDILGLVGAGGMGEVYRARDPRLGRDVAIKVLPADRVADENRRRRFVQEAQAASALNHPHIITIHEIDTAGDHDFIVMEYVPGKSVDALIPRQGMRLSDALRIAIPVADALAAAHARGIIHRDLKPGNVMVGTDGAVKVLDFGLAKLVGADKDSDAEMATVTAQGALSAPGAVAGTAAYMAPEQATGGKVDARSDIFSFGAMLYEMATGVRAFGGTSINETLSAVIRTQPQAPSDLVRDLPKELERIILRCLRKEPDRRFQNMADVKIELLEVKEESDSGAVTSASVAVPKRRSGRRWLIAGVAVALTLAAAAAAISWRQPRLVVPPPTVVQLTTERQAGIGSFSPDGTQIAYSSSGERGENWDIYLRLVGEVEARRLTTDPTPDESPAWSRDGKQIAFVRYDVDQPRIYLVSPLGGAARQVSDFPVGPPSWSPDGRWLAAGKARSGNDPPGGIHLISVENGETRAVTFPKPPAFDVSPAFSPDGQTLAYAGCEGAEAYPFCDVYVVTLDAALAPQGAARRLTQQRLWSAGLTWTRDGRSIVYSAAFYLWRVGLDGSAGPERVEVAGRAFDPRAAASRDRLIFVRPGSDSDLYRLPLGGSPAPLIESAFFESNAKYSPDGRRIAFESDRAGERNDIWLADADGSNPVQLTRGPGRSQGSPHWSPDGALIAFDSYADDGHADVWTIGASGSGLRRITHDPADDVVPDWSQDGRYVYFVSNRTGRFEAWRVPVHGGMEEQVTRDGGIRPSESFDGRTLYYSRRIGGELVARPLAGGEERRILPCVTPFGWAVARGGIFHVHCGTSEATASRLPILRFWDAATGEDRVIATLDVPEVGTISVSPDGKNVLYDGSRAATSLFMIENFR